MDQPDFFGLVFAPGNRKRALVLRGIGQRAVTPEHHSFFRGNGQGISECETVVGVEMIARSDAEYAVACTGVAVADDRHVHAGQIAVTAADDQRGLSGQFIAVSDHV